MNTEKGSLPAAQRFTIYVFHMQSGLPSTKQRGCNLLAILSPILFGEYSTGQRELYTQQNARGKCGVQQGGVVDAAQLATKDISGKIRLLADLLQLAR